MSLRRKVLTFLVFIVFCSLILGYAKNGISAPGNKGKLEFSLGAGYFTPVREGFREYYGSNLQYEIGGAYKISALARVGADFSFIRLPKDPLEFRMFSLIPSIQVLYPRNPAFYLGGGVGFCTGTVYLETIRFNQNFPESFKKKQTEYGVAAKALAGYKLFLSSEGFLAFEGRYTHTFMGDPHQGDFGNVGGFSGVVKLGFLF